MKRFFTALLFVILCTLSTIAYGQTIQDLEQEIAIREQAMEDLEKQITVNGQNGNAAGNASLEQQIDNHEQEISRLVKKIKVLNNGGSISSTADCEQEVMLYQAEIDATKKIVDDLEAESLELQREIQRLTLQGGGTAALDKLRLKNTQQRKEIDILKGQIRGYKTQANQPSSSTGASTADVNRLERKIARLERDKKNLRERIQNKSGHSSRSTVRMDAQDFQKQFINEFATTMLLGYRYTLLPSINFLETPALYQSCEQAGTLTSTPNQQTMAHNGFLGLERLWHGSTFGGNIGLTGLYGYNHQPDLTYNLLGVQLGGELTILPLRLGLRVAGSLGYLWGNLEGHDALLTNGMVEYNPDFSTAYWGWEGKVRIYTARSIAFTGSIGADYPLSKELEMDFWGTSLKFGLGVDILFQLSR